MRPRRSEGVFYSRDRQCVSMRGKKLGSRYDLRVCVLGISEYCDGFDGHKHNIRTRSPEFLN